MTEQRIPVFTEAGVIVCKRCDRQLKIEGVAFLTRTAPGEAFEAWCPPCALTLSKWALSGMESGAPVVVINAGEVLD